MTTRVLSGALNMLAGLTPRLMAAREGFLGKQSSTEANIEVVCEIQGRHAETTTNRQHQCCKVSIIQ
jgi:hypothetical protein